MGKPFSNLLYRSKNHPPCQLSFKKNGRVTLLNVNGLNDVAAAILAARKDVLKTYSLRPKDIIIVSAIVGIETRKIGRGPHIVLQPSTRFGNINWNKPTISFF